MFVFPQATAASTSLQGTSKDSLQQRVLPGHMAKEDLSVLVSIPYALYNKSTPKQGTTAKIVREGGREREEQVMWSAVICFRDSKHEN